MLSLLEPMLNASLFDTSATLIVSCKFGIVVGRGDALPDCLACHHMQDEESHASGSTLVSCPQLNREEHASWGSRQVWTAKYVGCGVPFRDADSASSLTEYRSAIPLQNRFPYAM